jgi:Holliday junction resolvase RusA-like endonuclease
MTDRFDTQPDRVIHMPVPPSTNRLWVPVSSGMSGQRRTRARSPEYQSWRANAGWMVKQQIMGTLPIDCRFNVLIQVPLSRRDTGNFEKPIMDLLESIGAISNDGNAHEIRVQPMERYDVSVALWILPDMGQIRAPGVKRREGRHPWQRTKPGLTWRRS